VLRLVLAALWLVAVWRPDRALVALAFVVPFGSVALTWLDAAPVRLTEAMTLAVLSGSLIASLRLRTSDARSPKSDVQAAIVFSLVVLASLAVVLAGREIGMRTPWTALRSLALFLTHDYLVGPAPELAGITDAALLLEGLGLLWIVRRYAREHTALLVGALAAAATGAVLLSFTQAADSVGADGAARGIVAGLLRARASGPVADVNAAGSLFAMAACTVIGLALGRRTTQMAGVVWSVIGAALLAGVWLSGSRMALVAAIGGGMLLAAYTRLSRSRQRTWTIAALAVAAAVVLIALTVGLDPRPAATRTASHSFSARADFMVTGLRMIASAPVFGVGVGRYFEMSGLFMPPSIYWFYFHENAHNNFLQIGGELGLLGLGAFVWLLTAAALRIIRAVRKNPADTLLVASGAGAATFVATWLTSHPLLVPEVAYPFWIVLGVALARADAALRTDTPEPAMATRERLAAGVVALLVLCSVPLRARDAGRSQPLDQVAFGFYDWENDNGFPYRWSSRRATFFVPARARELHLPVRSMMILGHLDPVRFSVAVNGRVLDTFSITQGNWETVQLRLPPASDGSAFTRIDVMTEPPWTPAATGANHDVRVLGVQVGRPDVR
jgi:O-antigen ligase